MWNSPQSINRWKSLLNSPDSANRRVALTLAQAHKLPDDIRDAVLIEKLTHPDRKQVQAGMELAIALGGSLAMEALYFRYFVIGTVGTSYGWVKAYLNEQQQLRAGNTFKNLGYGMEYETASMLAKMETLDAAVSTERIAGWLCAAQGIRRPIRYLAFQYLQGRNTEEWIAYALPHFVDEGRLSLSFLSKLPEAIFAMEDLKVIYSMGGSRQLYTFPEGLTAMKSLEEINFPINRIEALPESICNMGRLRSLDLSYNPVKELPECMASMPSLKKITVTMPLISVQAKRVLAKIKEAKPDFVVEDNAK
jgi:hypothetical protein